MTKRVCAQRDCPVLVDQGRCPDHRRQSEQHRGRRQVRGYDAQHVQLRAAWQQRMDEGERVVCWRCESLGRPHMVDPTAWALGHCDNDPARYHGPECVAGNNATAGRSHCPHRSHRPPARRP